MNLTECIMQRVFVFFAVQLVLRAATELLGGGLWTRASVDKQET